MSDRLAGNRRLVWLRLCCLVLLVAVQTANSTAWAACSSFLGKFTINELNLINTNTDEDVDPGNDTALPFVELKVLDQEIIDQIAAGTWSFAAGWKVTAIKANGNQYAKDLPTIYTGIPGSNTNNLCRSSTSVYIRIPFANDELQDTGNVILSDPSGAIVDILRVSKDSTISSYYSFADATGPFPNASNQYPNPVCSTCNALPGAPTCSGANQLIYDTDFGNFASGGQASKDIQRLPDGTGPWKEAPGGGSNTQQTLCTTNDNVLLLTKTPSAYSVPQGTNVTYTLTAKGSANYATGSPNTNVVISEPLPAGLTYVGHSSPPSHGSASYASGSNTITWTIASLAVGVTASMTVTATVSAAGAITNTVTGTSTELAGANTQTSATLNALRIEVQPDNSIVALNGDVTYTITITNDSSASVTSVAASLPLPAGLSFVSAGTPTAGTFNSASMAWTNIGTLAPGASATLTITARATQTGTIAYPVSATTTLYPGTFSGSGSITVGQVGSFQISIPDFKAGDGTAVAATITAQDSAGVPRTGFVSAVRKVKFYYQAVNPASASGTMKMDAYEAASNTVSVGNLATSLATAVTRDVYFDANGVGSFDLNYDNVGEFTLSAEWQPAYESAPPSGSPAQLSGSDAFIVTPYRYDIVPAVNSAAGGTTFDVTVTAQALCGKVNWGYVCPGASSYTTATDFAGAAASAVTLSVDSSGLNNNPAMWCTATATTICPNDETASPSIAGNGFALGVATVTGLHWSEVGSAVLKAEAAYLGSATLSNLGNTVTFHPSRFGASGSVTSDAGATFLYYGQPGLDFAQTIAAEVPRPDGTYRTAQNYAAGVYGGTLATVVSQSTVSGTALNACTDTTCAASVTNGAAASCTWTLGVCQVLASDALFQRDDAAPAVVKTVAFNVLITDTENKVGSCVKSSAPANCTGTPNVFSADYGSIELRYGRIRLQNAFGSEKLALTVPVTAEYWTASGWITNTLDNTTQWLTTASNAGTPASAYSPGAYASNTGAQACYGSCASATAANAAGTAAEWADAGGTLLIANVTTANPLSPIVATSSLPLFPAQSPDSTTLVGGRLALSMTAPTSLTGSFDLTMVVPPWLRLNSANPKAKVAFGIYKGSNRVIYRREVR